MRQTTLLFPPFAESALFGPHLAPGLLAGVLQRGGEPADARDLNIRLVRRLFTPSVALEAAAAVRAALGEGLSGREDAGLRWFVDAAVGSWYAEHPATVRYVLRTIRRALFPVPLRIEDCLSGLDNRHPLAVALYAELIAEIAQDAPAVVGMSVAFAEQLSEAAAIAAQLRRSLPDTAILLGGSQINLLQAPQLERLAGAELFDAVLVPNGETGIVDLVGSAGRNGRGAVVRSRSLTQADLVDLPRPAFDDLALYLRPLSIPVLATKGCYWGQCSFCDYVQLSDIGHKRYLVRPVEDALAEIRHAQNAWGAERIMLISDAVPPAWYARLATMAAAEGTSLRSWSYMMHHDHLDRGFFERLAAAGVAAINFGTETSNDRILKLMRKQTGPSAIRCNLRDAHGSGIHIIANVIADYPTTTFEEALQVASDFEDMSEFIDTLNPSMFDLTAGTLTATAPLLHDIEVRQDAYSRSNHGFHTLSFRSAAPLTEAQRLALRLIYARLASSIKLRRRVRAIARRDSPDHASVRLDRGALISRRGAPEAKIPALDCVLQLAAWEVDALRSVLGIRGGRASSEELRHIAVEAGASQPGDWLARLVNGGMVEAIAAA